MSHRQKQKVLIVEDDQELASMIGDYLSTQGFETSVEGRGDHAVARIKEEAPDVVLLDVNLPGMDGFTVCRRVRSEYPGPILILTARGEEIDEVVGLEIGADDYMAKPVRPRVLLARIRVHLRKTSTPDSAAQSPIQVGELIIDPARRTVVLSGKELDLTTAEFDLLHLLATHAGSVLSRSQIYPQLHGLSYDGLDRSIDLRVSRLRKKLGDTTTNPKRIKSVRGVGYILSVDQ